MSTAHTIGAGHGAERTPLPERGALWITDAGLETELVFKDGLELPHFSAAVLMESESGRERLRRYFRGFVELARRRGVGLVLETPTWRISPDWADRIGLDEAAVARIHREAVALLSGLRDASGLGEGRFVVSGNLGPRYDGYQPEPGLSADEALAYHKSQVALFAAAGADAVSALTLPTSAEATGIARAAAAEGIPAVICFTVETDGRLPSGEPLGEAIDAVDAAAPGAVAYFGINCAHPTHFLPALEATRLAWRERIGTVRPNASRCSHAEIDGSSELDEGDPVELASHSARLRELLPGLRVIGGCCGTDLRHVTQLCHAFLAGRGPDTAGPA